MKIHDALDILKNLLIDKWGSYGETIPTPRIIKVWEERATGIIDDLQDAVLLIPEPAEGFEYFQFSGIAQLHHPQINIEIRTFGTEERHNAIIKNITLIIEKNISGTNYVDLRILSARSESQYYRNMFRHIITVEFRILNSI